MPARSCRVTITDFDGVEHTVQVTAETLYEAVARALKAMQGKEWIAGIPEGLNREGVRHRYSNRAHRDDEGFLPMVEQHWPKPEGPDEPLQDQRDFRNGCAEVIQESF